MKSSISSTSSTPKASSIQPAPISADIPRSGEDKRLSTAANASPTPSPTSQPSSHSRSHSFPFPFHGRSLSESAANNSIFTQRSRSRTKSPTGHPAPPTALPKTTQITTSATQAHAQPKRTASDQEVSPIASSPTTRLQDPKKGKRSSASISHSGRHSNDWLFHGFSVTETVKGFLHKDEEAKRPPSQRLTSPIKDLNEASFKLPATRPVDSNSFKVSAARTMIVQYGLTEVYSTLEPQVDVILVHGLNGHPYDTWATHDPQIFWPTDLLPLVLEEQRCRVLTYGYDAGVGTFTDGPGKNKIHNHAEHLAGRLVANRSLKKATERPLIFVCHSLGGLLVKRCLIYCKSFRNTDTQRLRSIYVSTFGILFLGTPHNWSDDTQWEIIGRFRVCFFYESKLTNANGLKRFVVDEESAAPRIEDVERMGIERDHVNMCKFEVEDTPGFEIIAHAIQRYASEAPALISQRWDEERRVRHLKRQEAARELLGDTASQWTTMSQIQPLENISHSIRLIGDAERSSSPSNYRNPTFEGNEPYDSEEDFGYKHPFESYGGGENLEMEPNRSTPDPNQRPSLFLKQGFASKSRTKNTKDLGQWRPLPVPPSTASSSTDRATGSISGNSEAEAALAAIHRSNPPMSRDSGYTSSRTIYPTTHSSTSRDSGYASRGTVASRTERTPEQLVPKIEEDLLWRPSFLNSLDPQVGRSELEVELSLPTPPEASIVRDPVKALINSVAESLNDNEETELSAMDVFIKNPWAYFESVERLQSRIFELGRAALGEIQRDGDGYVLVLPFTSVPNVSESNLQMIMQLLPVLERNYAIICVILQGLNTLKEAKFCGPTYNIITLDSKRDNVLRIVAIDTSTLLLLQDLLEEAVACASGPTDRVLNEQMIEDIGETIEMICHNLDLPLPYKQELDFSYRQNWHYLFELLSSTCSVLFLGMVSFIKSHLNDHDESFGTESLDELCMRTLDGQVFMTPRRLSCLDSFVKHPVWTFSTNSARQDFIAPLNKRYHLSTYLGDFAELWGPVTLIYFRDSPLKVDQIKIRGGVIQATSMAPLPGPHSEPETMCHFYPWTDADFHRRKEADCKPIYPTTALLIGAPRSDTESEAEEPFLIRETCSCQPQTRYTNWYHPFELKTKGPRWKLDQRQAQISGGQYITAVYGQTWKFHAGWTLKDVIIEEWLENGKKKAHPKPFYLDYLVVLEISHCSGHSRRISLWDMLKLRATRSYLEAILYTSDCRDLEIIVQCFPHASFSEIWKRMTPGGKELLKMVIEQVLDTLRGTGVDEQGMLVAWDITTCNRIDGRRIDPRWRSMIKDDVDSATFAIITSHCFEITGQPGSNSASEKPQLEVSTMLLTKICITLQQESKVAKSDRSYATSTDDFVQWQVKQLEAPTRIVVPGSTPIAAIRHNRDISESNRTAVSSIRERQAARQALRQSSQNGALTSSRAYQNQAVPKVSQDVGPNSRSFQISNPTIGQHGHCPCPQEPSSRVLCDVTLHFKNGRGQNIGTLILEPRGGAAQQIDLSEAGTLPAKWKAHSPGLLDSVREKAEGMDKDFAKRVGRSKGSLPWMINRFFPLEEPKPFVVEHIRGGDLTVYQKVLKTYIR